MPRSSRGVKGLPGIKSPRFANEPLYDDPLRRRSLLMHPGWIAAIAAGVVVLFVVAVYNGLISRWLETKNAYSQIEVQLKRRYDLIPNLVETVKGYATHERETLERIVQARAAAMTG